MRFTINHSDENNQTKIENLQDLFIFLVMVSVYAIPDMGSICILLRIIFILFSIMQYIKKKLYIEKIYFMWGVVFIVVSLVSSIFASNQEAALYIWINIVQCILIGFLLSEWIRCNNEKFINYSIYASLIFSVRLLVNTDFSNWSSRKASFMMGLNVNAIGLRAVFAFLLIMYMLIICSKNKKKFYISALALVGSTILICASRRAIIVAVFSTLLIVVLMSKRPSKIFKTLVISAIILILLGWIVMTNSTLYLLIGSRLEAMLGTFLESGSLLDTTRSGLIDDGIKLFMQRPLLGWGNGAYEYVGSYNLAYTHNNYVELLFAEGIVGACAYLWIYIYIIYMAIKNWKQSNNSKLILVMIMSIMLADIASPTYYTMNIQLLLVYGIVSVKRNRGQQKLIS